jgi:hypothetical protein
VVLSGPFFITLKRPQPADREVVASARRMMRTFIDELLAHPAGTRPAGRSV